MVIAVIQENVVLVTPHRPLWNADTDTIKNNFVLIHPEVSDRR